MKKVLPLCCAALVLLFVSCQSTGQTGVSNLVDVDASGISVEGGEDSSQADGQDSSQDDSAANEEQDEGAGAEQNESAKSAAEAARQAALDAGAKDAYGTAFAANDAALNALKALDDGKDHGAEYADIKARYDALAAAARAKKLKERIDGEGLAANSQADYDAGEKALGEFDAMLSAAVVPGATLNKKASEAYDSYYAVYFKSYKKFANAERKNALVQKKAADAVKAQVSRKDEYKADADLIIKGDQQYATSNPEGAYNSYKEAANNFEALAADVAEKRAAAQKAIEEAKARVKAAGEYAEKADEEKPLGDEPVAGIEAEDTVLLEADEFKNPDEQVIEIDENVQGEN